MHMLATARDNIGAQQRRNRLLRMVKTSYDVDRATEILKSFLPRVQKAMANQRIKCRPADEMGAICCADTFVKSALALLQFIQLCVDFQGCGSHVTPEQLAKAETLKAHLNRVATLAVDVKEALCLALTPEGRATVIAFASLCTKKMDKVRRKLSVTTPRMKTLQVLPTLAQEPPAQEYDDHTEVCITLRDKASRHGRRAHLEVRAR